MTNSKCPKCDHQNPDSSRFCNQCGTPILTETRDELRVVTLMFADIKGFTSLSERLPPDEVKDILDEIFAKLTTIIQDESGQVIKYEGDLIMAGFGLEVSDHRGPHHAAYAALKMQDQLLVFSEKLEERLGLKLQMRIGMHTGKAVVGMIGNRLDVLGDSVNLAARLEQNAPVGGILTSQTMAKLIEEEFELNHLKPINVKGKANSIAVSELISRKDLTIDHVFVSRTNQIQEIEEFVNSSKDRFQYVAIFGQPGTGKTSFLRKIQQECRETVDTVPVSLSKEWKKHLLLSKLVLSKLIQGVFGVALDDYLESDGLDHQYRVMLEAVSGKTDISQVEFQGLNFLENQGFLFELMLQFIGELKVQTLLLLVDDIQFLDEASKSFLIYLSFNSPIRVLLVASTNQELGTLFGRSPTMSLTLENFNLMECKDLFKHFSHDAPDLPQDLLEEIYNQSKGNPRFTTELIRFLLDDKIIKTQSGQVYWDRLDLERRQLPSSMELVLQAKYDQLDDQLKLFLRYCACFDEYIFFETLESSLGGEQTNDHYSRLLEAGMLTRLRIHSELEVRLFSFEDSHFQKIIYSSMPGKEKRKIHQDLYLGLKQDFKSRELLKGGRPLLLSSLFYQCQQAQLQEDVLELGIEIVDLYTRRKQFGRALEVCDHLMNLEDFNIAILDSKERLQFIHNYLGALDIKSESTRLLDLADFFKSRIQESDKKFQVEMMTLLALSRLARTQTLIEVVERMEVELGSLKISDKQRFEWEVQLQLNKAMAFETEGKLQQAAAICQSILTKFPLEDNDDLLFHSLKTQARIEIRLDLSLDREQNKQNIETLNRCEKYFEQTRQMPQQSETLLSMFHYYSQRGNFDECIRINEKVIDIAKKTGNPAAIASALADLGETYLSRPETLGKSLSYYFQALEVWKSLQEDIPMARCLNDIGTIYWRKNQLEEAVNYTRQSLEIWKKCKVDLGIALYSYNVATYLISLNRPGEARIYIKESLTAYDRIQDKSTHLRFRILLGGLLVKTKDLNDAQALLEECVQISKSSSKKNQVLTLLYLADLRLNQSRVPEARELVNQARDLQGDDQDVPEILNKLEAETNLSR